MEAVVYNQSGKESGKVTLPEAVFGVKWNGDLVHQVVVSMQANARPHVAKVKDRSEVAGGGRKPWRQKGTGRARHGSNRSPIWVGGGVTHGPNPDKVYARKINKKMRSKALFIVLSRKFKDGEVLFVKDVSVVSGKTKDAKTMLQTFSGIKGFEKLIEKKNNAALVTIPERDEATERGLRNFPNISVLEARNLNPVEVLSSKYLVISNPESSIETIVGRVSKQKVVKAVKK